MYTRKEYNYLTNNLIPMKKIFSFVISIVFIILLINTGCKQYEIVTKTIISQPEVKEVTVDKASVTAEILEIGKNLKSYGFCYGTKTNPTLDDNKTANLGENGKIGLFTQDISDLNPNTQYYIRTYAEDDVIRYGYVEQNFTTEPIGAPTVTTNEVTNIAYTTALCGGNITNDGGRGITARGVCWSTSPNPTTSDYHTSDGSGTGTFTSNISGLTENTSYYIRAYAINFAGTSYGDEKNFTTAPSTVTDYDGNVYNTVIIGNQIWLKEDLKVSHYSNGDAIPYIDDDVTWAALADDNTSDAYCFYGDNNNDGTVDIAYPDYGALYTWAAAMGDNAVSSNTNPSGVQGVCPDGWHLPSDAEWTELTDYLGGEAVAGGKMKETGTTHWNSPNTGATNESGFTGLPSGRCNLDGTFFDMGDNGYWWSAREGNSNSAFYRHLNYYNNDFHDNTTYLKSGGLSVRCVID